MNSGKRRSCGAPGEIPNPEERAADVCQAKAGGPVERRHAEAQPGRAG